MFDQKRKNLLGLLVVVCILAGTFNPSARSFFSIPSQQRVLVGDHIRLNLNIPEELSKRLSLYVVPGSKVLFLNGVDVNGRAFSFSDGWPVAAQPGQAKMQIRLFGLIPIKNVKVEVLPQTKLVPGGQSVGVLLHSEGVIIVGQSIVEDKEGHKYNPAAAAGVKVGDIILKVNNSVVTSDEQVAKLIDKAGKSGEKKVKLLIKRKSKTFSTWIQPVLCNETGRYRIGLYVRDSAAGVGTLSFYNPETGKYGALGHIISDADTNQPINVSDGRIVRASIQGIQAGRKGQPGEKIGMFINDSSFSGTIEKNTKYGIYGKLNGYLDNPLYSEPIPIALADQIKTGPAEMLTVLDGEKIEKFSVRIKRILPQSTPDSKGLIVEVTDPRLLKRTGGIIQGMSGSPLVQNGKIIGAVTHVFINDPTSGYGCQIEWMLIESGGSKSDKQKVSKRGNEAFLSCFLLLNHPPF